MHLSSPVPVYAQLNLPVDVPTLRKSTMGAGASTTEPVSEEAARTLAARRWDQGKWDSLAKDGLGNVAAETWSMAVAAAKAEFGGDRGKTHEVPKRKRATASVEVQFASTVCKHGFQAQFPSIVSKHKLRNVLFANIGLGVR